MDDGERLQHPSTLANTLWDAVVVGAGPAGAVSAALLADRGWNVLLLERAAWPRQKVCGGCLTAAAVRALRDNGFGGPLQSAIEVDRCSIRVASRSSPRVSFPLPRGVAVDRAPFDVEMVRSAVERGATFVAGVATTLLPLDGNDAFRTIRLNRSSDGDAVRVRARAVLACDGIGGNLLVSEPWARWEVSPDAWFGVAARLPKAIGIRAKHGEIAMHVDADGYAGIANHADGDVHLAAALRPDVCRQVGGPGVLVERILRSCGQANAHDVRGVPFRGTGLLTRRRPVLGGHRVLAVGDACGYVEPFTGEGIEWAIRGAVEVVELLGIPATSWRSDLPDRWRRRHAATIGRDQRMCRVVRWALHRPRIATGIITVAAWAPRAVGALMRCREHHVRHVLAGPRQVFA